MHDKQIKKDIKTLKAYAERIHKFAWGDNPIRLRCEKVFIPSRNEFKALVSIYNTTRGEMIINDILCCIEVLNEYDLDTCDESWVSFVKCVVRLEDTVKFTIKRVERRGIED